MRVLLLSIVLAVTACSGAQEAAGEASDPRITGRIDAQHRAALFQLTEIEFDCPPEQVHLTRLDVPGWQVLAEGCGYRGVYVYAAGAGWLLNSVRRTDEPEAAPELPMNDV